jgi:serine protease inhibitor
LEDALGALGMTDAFTPGTADFSGMDGARDLFVQAVVHKALVRVDEEGTVAAAASAVAVAGAGPPDEQKIFEADRPFVFLIRDRKTEAILFLGRVLDPTA